MAKEKKPQTASVDKGLIINAIKVIDAAAERGAFRGGELSTVGQVRDMLYATVAADIEDLAAEREATNDE